VLEQGEQDDQQGQNMAEAEVMLRTPPGRAEVPLAWLVLVLVLVPVPAGSGPMIRTSSPRGSRSGFRGTRICSGGRPARPHRGQRSHPYIWLDRASSRTPQ
jgi:hypothetical protein